MTTSWLSAPGLGIEIVGLLCLFFDLWKSKSTSSRTEAFRNFQEQIDRQSQDLIVSAYKAISTLSKAIREYFILKDKAEKPEQEISASDREMMEVEPEFADFMRIVSSQNLSELTEKTLRRAQQELKSPDEVNEDIKKISALRVQIDSEFVAPVDFSELLRKIAYAGIVLVLIGGGFQFVDLVFI